MSHATPHASASPDPTVSGFSLGSGLSILVAAFITGGLISFYRPPISWPFLAIFAIASILVITFVNPKGLFLTVASIPLLFTVAVPLTGLLIAFGEGQTLGRTTIVIALYPLVQYFPVLLFVTLGALIIAFVRYRLLKRQNDKILRQEEALRRKTTESNRKTRREAARSRRRSSDEWADEQPEPRRANRWADEEYAHQRQTYERPAARRRASERETTEYQAADATRVFEAARVPLDNLPPEPKRTENRRITVEELIARRNQDRADEAASSGASRGSLRRSGRSVRHRLDDDLYGN